MAVPASEQFRWTEERIDLMRQWAAEGLTASAIAARFFQRFGAMPSRSAVIGKCRRAGIALHGVAAAAEPKAAPATVVPLRPVATGQEARRLAGRQAQRDRAPTVLRKPAPVVAQPPPDPPAPPTCEPVAFAALELRHCRFPIGDPRHAAFGFCGADKGDDLASPYCPYHRGIAYIPPGQRKAAAAAIDRAAAWGGR